MSRPSRDDMQLNDGGKICITRPLLASAREMLEYPRGFAFGAARLDNVRRIHVSGGMLGRSRTDRHVSGIRLEYDKSCGGDAVILGQWMQEFEGPGGQPLEMALGERITEMTTWHGYTDTCKRLKFGPITLLWLRTSHGIERVFPPSASLSGQRNGQICLQYRENPYERLRGILWGCNYEWDHVRALYHPKTTGPLPRCFDPAASPALVYLPKVQQRTDFYGPEFVDSAWVVREQAFMYEKKNRKPLSSTNAEVPLDEAKERDSGDDDYDPATAIEVSYRKGVGGDPIGISIIYSSGSVVTIGTRKEERALRQEIDCAGGERLLRMDFGLRRGNRFDYIKVSLHFQPPNMRRSTTVGERRKTHRLTKYAVSH